MLKYTQFFCGTSFDILLQAAVSEVLTCGRIGLGAAAMSWVAESTSFSAASKAKAHEQLSSVNATSFGPAACHSSRSSRPCCGWTCREVHLKPALEPSVMAMESLSCAALPAILGS